MNVIRRVRACSAATAVACVVFVVAVGTWALLSLRWGSFDPQSVHSAAVEAATIPVSNPSELDTSAPRALAAREADGESLNGQRVALALEAELAADEPFAIPALPAGELEVVVHIADRPADGSVELQRVTTNDVTVPLDRIVTMEAPLEGGVARFHDVPRGVVLVGVHVGFDPPHRVLWVNSRVRGARLEIELGDANIHGRVRDPDGAAVEGARVIVSGRHGTVVASSAADGSYRAGEHFPAGRYTVAVEGLSSAISFPRRVVDLAPGMTRDVSFGPGSDLSRWRGRVLAANGAHVREGDGLCERAVQLVARNGGGAALDVDIVDGAIDQWFEPDLYAVRVGSGEGEHPELALTDPRETFVHGPDTIDLSSDVVRDVILGGFVLRGQVEPPGEVPMSISLRGDGLSARVQAWVQTGGAFRFVGLELGTYELSWATNSLTSVVIDPHGPIEVDIDLTLPADMR